MKTILDDQQARQLVEENKYKVNSKTKFIARCIDGRYLNDENLPALAIAGADAGELAVLFATARSYAFEIDKEKTLQVLCDVVGGEKNLRMHTDTHGDRAVLCSGCGHIKLMKLNPTIYSLESQEIEFILKKCESACKKGAEETELQGDHQEGAVLIVKGSYGIKPQFVKSQVFIVHQGLINERHRKLAEMLIESKAVTLPEKCDVEYLYSAISEVTDNHLMETARQLAKDLPIYSVDFEESGDFKLEKIGQVE